jgi:hypothetical protein
MALSESGLRAGGVIVGHIYTDRGRKFTVKPKTVRAYRASSRRWSPPKGRRR